MLWKPQHDLVKTDPREYDFSALVTAPVNSTRYYMLVLYGIIRSNGLQYLVELGTFHGVTTAFLARAAVLNDGHLWTVDDGREGVWADPIGGVTYIRGKTAEAVAYVPVHPDFVFFDADHTYEGIKADWAAWGPLITVNGFACFHDTADPDVHGFLATVFPHPDWDFLNLPGDHGLGIARRRR